MHTHTHIYYRERKSSSGVSTQDTRVVGGGWMDGGGGKKKKEKSIRGGFYPDHPLPLYSLERGPVLEEAFILWLFVLSRERSAIFFLRPRHPQCTHTHIHTYIATVKTKMKNSTLAAKTIFYPLAWPSFTLRPPVQSIPAIIASLSSPHHALRDDYVVMRPKTRRGFFFFLLFYFFPLTSLKNQFDAKYVHRTTYYIILYT